MRLLSLRLLLPLWLGLGVFLGLGLVLRHRLLLALFRNRGEITVILLLRLGIADRLGGLMGVLGGQLLGQLPGQLFRPADLPLWGGGLTGLGLAGILRLLRGLLAVGVIFRYKLPPLSSLLHSGGCSLSVVADRVHDERLSITEKVILHHILKLTSKLAGPGFCYSSVCQ